jgi:O-acetyl-ADP-ribose deacetylase (regulator of RNase III)/ADP-ribose pyrophosphatase YjhB (NUDIX family)
MKLQNTELKIIQGDITQLDCDAIVNPADTSLLMNAGLAGVIRQSGGGEIESEAVAKGPIKVGGAIWTKAGRLKCRYIIHAATMGKDNKTDEMKIRRACANALRCANQLNVTSLAFPALGCGVGGFPPEGAAKVMAQEMMKFFNWQKTMIGEVIFCLYDKETFEKFDKAVNGYIRHLQETLGKGPYITVDAIIEHKEGIILIERSNPPYGWALPGGFVDYGESLEEAVTREAKEETNMDLVNLRQFRAYSDPQRDPRFHTIGMVFIAKGKGKPKSGDDAKGLRIIPYKGLLKMEYAFDHKDVIRDYLKARKSRKF